jgi:hypothetical protein
MSIDEIEDEDELSEEEYSSLTENEKSNYWYNYFSSQIRSYSEIAHGDIDDSISRAMYVDAKRIDSNVTFYLAQTIADYKLNKFRLLSKGILLPVFYSIFL